ncbi:MAG: hypothetical protein KDA93_23115 [Planctomycetaceae bacterium]|nr:hypothetical protein [Planctomycetaceae bacterium]
MASYGHLARLLIGQPSIIPIAMLTSLWVGICLVVLGAWLPCVWTSLAVRRDEDATNLDHFSTVRLLALFLAGGLTSLLVTGTASAFLFHDLLLGIIVSAVIGVASVVRLMLHLDRGQLRLSIGRRVLVIVTLLPFLLGVWLHEISEVRFNTVYGQGVAFGSLNDDNSFHVYLASMIEQHGLPLRDLYGSPHQDYAPLVHTGHGVLIASIARITGINLYQSAAALWTVGLVLLAWTGCDVMSRVTTSPSYIFLGALSPLVLGPINLPSIVPFWRPGEALDQVPLVAARMYWNLPQTLSTALVGVSLVCFGEYLRNASNGRNSQKQLMITTLLIVASGWVKPSLFIFFAPAMLITLLIHRRGVTDLVIVTLTLGTGVLVYLLPHWLVTLPEAPVWSLTHSLVQTIEVGKFVALGCGTALLLAMKPLWILLRSIGARVTADELSSSNLALPLVAMGGSLMFALLFREDRFIGHVAFQPNIWWGPSGCVVLLIPWLMRFANDRLRDGNSHSWLAIIGIALLSLQTINGIVFAFACPAINTRVYPQPFVEALERARDATATYTTFLIDPGIANIDLANLLHRPALYTTSYMSEPDRQMLDAWNSLFVPPFDESKEDTWRHYDAAIVSNTARVARESLSQREWKMSPLTPLFELWLNPNGRAGDVGSLPE